MVGFLIRILVRFMTQLERLYFLKLFMQIETTNHPEIF